MEIQNNVVQIYNRIMQIPYELDIDDYYSMQLMAEYIRRIVNIMQRLPQIEVRGRPFFDIAYDINPNIRADEKTIHEVTLYSPEKNMHVWTQRVCEWALHFAALQDSNSQNESLHQSPYESLIVLFEKGGVFTVKGEILIGGGSISTSEWWRRFGSNPIVELS